jgi:hypothetical protein
MSDEAKASNVPVLDTVQQALNAVVATPDAVIAPEHEGRLQKIESIFKDWEPLLMKLATIAEKVV